MSREKVLKALKAHPFNVGKGLHVHLLSGFANGHIKYDFKKGLIKFPMELGMKQMNPDDPHSSCIFAPNAFKNKFVPFLLFVETDAVLAALPQEGHDLGLESAWSRP